MPHHVVVDGSNLATEGRSQPSLRQLNEAVMAYIEEHPEALITVVVDATFGHRIDPNEMAEFDEAVNNNELVAPPAGAIGRGDAFVLSIANKVKATILTNDSYQEFHGQYDWLFDEGRLIGGKPVPHIGWVFVPRLPVRGPLSRKVTAEAKRKGRSKAPIEQSTVRVGSPDASQPMPVPKAPPPGRVTPVKRASKAKSAPPARVVDPPAAVAAVKHEPPARVAGVNDLLSFLTFVEQHPVGTSVNAIVDHYSSHGAYVKVGDVTGYVPLRLMANPAPRSAREFMKVGEAVILVVEKFVPEKRSIDLSIPGVGTAPLAESRPAKAPRVPKPTRATKAIKAPTAPTAAKSPKATKPPKTEAALLPEPVPAAPAVKAKRVTKKAVTTTARAEAVPAIASPVEPARTKAAPAKAPAKRAPAKRAPAAKAPAERSPAETARARKVAAKKAVVPDVPVPAKRRGRPTA